MNRRKELGDKGEALVAKYLKKHKYKIKDKNFSCKFGEIDIIAENKKYILFVEVKTRMVGQEISPMLSVGYTKQQKIIKTATLYMKMNNIDKQPRFDVAEVFMNDKGKAEINYIENAFWKR